jgi:hypothetical protein
MISRETIPIDAARNGYLSMAQYKRMFNTCRVPCRNKDRLEVSFKTCKSSMHASFTIDSRHVFDANRQRGRLLHQRDRHLQAPVLLARRVPPGRQDLAEHQRDLRQDQQVDDRQLEQGVWCRPWGSDCRPPRHVGRCEAVSMTAALETKLICLLRQEPGPPLRTRCAERTEHEAHTAEYHRCRSGR